MLGEFKNAFDRHNNAHVQLIIINVVVFLVLAVIYVFSTVSELNGVYEIVSEQFSIPSEFGVFITRPWTIITYGFSHSLTTLLHILFNMLSLYWFGRLFIEYLGSEKLVAVYILGVLAGGIMYLLMFNTIPYFTKLSGTMVGASAAVYAVMVAIATLLPDYTFYLIFLGPVRIKYIVLFFIVGSFLGSVGSNAGGNLAHLGGALIGFIYTKQLQAGVNWGGWITTTLDWFKRLFTAQPKVKVTYRSKAEPKANRPAAQKMSKASQEEIDAILDKISDRGYESLSKEEKEKLFNASKKN